MFERESGVTGVDSIDGAEEVRDEGSMEEIVDVALEKSEEVEPVGVAGGVAGGIGGEAACFSAWASRSSFSFGWMLSPRPSVCE